MPEIFELSLLILVDKLKPFVFLLKYFDKMLLFGGLRWKWVTMRHGLFFWWILLTRRWLAFMLMISFALFTRTWSISVSADLVNHSNITIISLFKSDNRICSLLRIENSKTYRNKRKPEKDFYWKVVEFCWTAFSISTYKKLVFGDN